MKRSALKNATVHKRRKCAKKCDHAGGWHTTSWARPDLPKPPGLVEDEEWYANEGEESEEEENRDRDEEEVLDIDPATIATVNQKADIQAELDAPRPQKQSKQSKGNVEGDKPQELAMQVPPANAAKGKNQKLTNLSSQVQELKTIVQSQASLSLP